MDQDWLIALFAEAAANPAAPVLVIAPMITPPKACARCGGEGRLPYFQHVKNGECFACHGTGTKKH